MERSALMEELLNNFASELPEMSLESIICETETPIDESSIVTELISSDPEEVKRSLDAIFDHLEKHDTTFHDQIYQRFLELSMCDDAEISYKACETLRRCISFPSECWKQLLEMGIFDLIRARFPAKPIWGIIGNLALQTLECRQAIYECGVLDIMPAAIQGRDKSIDETIAITCQGIVHNCWPEFDFEPFIPVLIAIFTELMNLFMETTTGHAAVVCAIRDLVEVHGAFLEWFGTNNGLQVLMASSCMEEGFMERMLRLFEILCCHDVANYVYECGALTWIEKAKQFNNPDIQEAMYSCIVSLIQNWKGSFCSDELYKAGWVKEATELFKGDQTPFRVKSSIAMFLAVMFNHASPDLVIQLYQEGVFKSLIEHFVMLDLDELYDVITRGTETLRRRSLPAGEEALALVRNNEDLLEWLQEEEATNEHASLLLSFICYDRDSEG